LRQCPYTAYCEPRLITEPRYREWLKQFPPEKLRINRYVEPQQGDVVLGTGQKLTRFCTEKKILHLFYAGFATNICVQFRDYGCRALRESGYNVILLRDCTTGIEVSQTVASLDMTNAAIRNIEMKVGTSTTGEMLRQACEHLVAAGVLLGN
jgi:nicotinamidase-related amidase